MQPTSPLPSLKCILKVSLTLALVIGATQIATVKSVYAKGGKDSGGGGDAIICRANRALSDETHPRIYLADYFELQFPLSDDFMRESFGNDEINLEHHVLNFLETNVPQEAALLRQVQLSYELVPGPLEELDDDDIKLSLLDRLNGCEKKQLAIQNLKTGHVRVSEPLYRQLSSFQKVMLRIHERYIHILKVPGETTLHVRQRTMKLFHTEQFNNVIIRIVAGTQTTSARIRAAIGNPVEWWQRIGRYEYPIMDIYNRFEALGFPLFDFENSARAYRRLKCGATNVTTKEDYKKWLNCATQAIGELEPDQICEAQARAQGALPLYTRSCVLP